MHCVPVFLIQVSLVDYICNLIVDAVLYIGHSDEFDLLIFQVGGGMNLAVHPVIRGESSLLGCSETILHLVADIFLNTLDLISTDKRVVNQ